MEVYEVVRTSRDTAICSDIVLRETKTTRLVFRPLLVHNAKDKKAPLKGSFIFQKKVKNDSWEDHNKVLLSKLKAEEWVKIELRTDEVDKLLRHMAALYRSYEEYNLPSKKAYFVKVDSDDSNSLQNVEFDIRKLIKINKNIGFKAFSDIAKWAAEVSNVSEVLEQLERLDINTLSKLNRLVGVSSLSSALSEWESNQENSNEEFWQNIFQKNAFVLSQVFSFPIVIIKGKAYMGGKSIDNTGGQLADFLAANSITKNAVIIEIKTPTTKLLGSKYRTVYKTDGELSGAINQLLNYRHNLTMDFRNVKSGFDFEVFNPQCLLIAGHIENQLKNDDMKKSFEMMRTGLRDITLIAYDELFQKTRHLIEALEGKNSNFKCDR